MILFSPTFVLLALAVVVARDAWVSNSVIAFFLILLALAVLGAEMMRIYLRRKP